MPIALISRDDLDHLRQNGVPIIDVRPRPLYEVTHVTGAVSAPIRNLPPPTLPMLAPTPAPFLLDEFTQAVAALNLNKNAPCAVYGNVAADGEAAAQQLAKLGFTDIRLFREGFHNWVAGQKACTPEVRCWACTFCSYGYWAHRGDALQKIEPGTLFEELPDNWRCPWCGAEKSRFMRE